MAAVNDFMFRNSEMAQKMEKKLNNQKYSDIVFLVNKTQFHASRHIVSLSSDVLDNLMETHCKGCAKNEIRIIDIKQDESFLLILKYLYGTDINFTKTNTTVMCEVLYLCERYQLSAFSKELKTFLSKCADFHLDSVVPLLNYANEFNAKELKDHLIIYAYKNTDQLVKHESFADLHYNVLIDLLKSDSFCTLEIDLLMGALTWHSKVPSNGLTVKPDSSSEPVKMSSEDVLKSLLSHIRISTISALDLINVCNTELLVNYKKFLADNTYGSPSCRARNAYVAPALVQENLVNTKRKLDVFSITKLFTVKSCPHKMNYSQEEYVIEGIKFKLGTKQAQNYDQPSVPNTNYEFYLNPFSDEMSTWDISVDVQVKIISKKPNYGGVALPTCSTNCSSTQVGKDFSIGKCNENKLISVVAYAPDQVFTVEVHFNCMHISGTVKVK